MAQILGANRREARRRTYGDTWRDATTHQTRRAQLAALVMVAKRRVVARRKRIAQAASAAYTTYLESA